MWAQFIHSGNRSFLFVDPSLDRDGEVSRGALASSDHKVSHAFGPEDVLCSAATGVLMKPPEHTQDLMHTHTHRHTPPAATSPLSKRVKTFRWIRLSSKWVFTFFHQKESFLIKLINGTDMFSFSHCRVVSLTSASAPPRSSAVRILPARPSLLCTSHLAGLKSDRRKQRNVTRKKFRPPVEKRIVLR